jgi:ATP-dependent DNA helicase UvrD/PcrA
LLINRRSRPQIIDAANEFAQSTKGRLPKKKSSYRAGAEPEIVTWRAATETEEADLIARSIVQLHKRGYRYRDVAILVRSSTSYDRLLKALAEHDVPVQPGGRTGLFKEADAQLFGRTFAYFAGSTWRSGPYGNYGQSVSLKSLVSEYAGRFALDAGRSGKVQKRLADWKSEVDAPWLFGALIDNGSRMSVFGGYLFGAALMIAGGLVAWRWAVSAERKPLEIVARPLTFIDIN